MSAIHSLGRRWGRLVLPLSETGESDLAGLDPARDILLALFTAALNCELEPVWEAAVAGTPLEGSTPVLQSLPIMPDLDAVREVKTAYPLLCVSRSQRNGARQFDDYSIEQRRLTQLWDIDYIIGPLAVTNLARLQDVLTTVDRIIDMVVDECGHKAYRSASSGSFDYAVNVLGENEDSVGLGSCWFTSATITESAVGGARFSPEGPKYHACGMTLRTTELEREIDGASGAPFTGSTGQFGLTQSGDPSIIVRTP